MNDKPIKPQKLQQRVKGGSSLTISELEKHGGYRYGILAEAVAKHKKLLLINGKETAIIPVGKTPEQCAAVIKSGKKSEIEELAFVYPGMNKNTPPFGVSSIVKTTAFGGLGPGRNRLDKENQMIAKLHNEIVAAIDAEATASPGKHIDGIRIKIGSNYHIVSGVVKVSDPAAKADAALIGPAGGPRGHDGKVKQEEIAWLSLKDGVDARSFQQWSGASESAARPIAEHPEVVSFIKTLKEKVGDTFPQSLTLYRDIKDQELKNMAIYGVEWNGSKASINNVDAILQGNPTLVKLVKTGHHYEIRGGHFIYNPKRIAGGPLEPVLMVRYSSDRNNFGIHGARVMIAPRGGRKATLIDEYKPG